MPRILLSYTFIAFVTFTLFEAILALAFASPKSGLLPRELLTSIYLRELRNVIQLMPECSQYDSYVSYTLKPGECRFKNLEFDTQYEINSAGFRDDELSLTSPEVVVLGDSFAMGWGVEQQETFVQIIENETGLRTLNAAISSFGTAREFRVLEQLDLSAAKYLVVQYMENDYQENQAFYEVGDLNIYSPEDRENVIRKLVPRAEYFFGKYTVTAVLYSWHYFRRDKMFRPEDVDRPDEAVARSGAAEVDAFLNVLQSSHTDLSSLRVIIFEIGPSNRNDTDFVDGLREQLRSNFDQNVHSKGLIVLDLSRVLEEDHYFYLDEHINAKGHRAVAEQLIEVLNR